MMNNTGGNDLCDLLWGGDANTTRGKIANGSELLKCEQWDFSGEEMFKSTIVSSFGLICGSSYKRKLSQAVFMGGVTAGASFWGQVSDRYTLALLGILSFPFFDSRVFGLSQ